MKHGDASTTGVCDKKHSPGEDDPWADGLARHQFRGPASASCCRIAGQRLASWERLFQRHRHRTTSEERRVPALPALRPRDGRPYADKASAGTPVISGPETGKRNRVTRKADGKLTLLVNLGGSWHEKLTLLVTNFSLPLLAYPLQGHSCKCVRIRNPGKHVFLVCSSRMHALIATVSGFHGSAIKQMFSGSGNKPKRQCDTNTRRSPPGWGVAFRGPDGPENVGHGGAS